MEGLARLEIAFEDLRSHMTTAWNTTMVWVEDEVVFTEMNTFIGVRHLHHLLWLSPSPFCFRAVIKALMDYYSLSRLPGTVVLLSFLVCGFY